jgi:hypothetical protein
MESPPGVDVTALVETPVPVRVALQIVAEVASALHAAYALPDDRTGEPLQLIHRDIAPANIRVTPQGTVEVLDSGVARAESRSREGHTTQVRFGSREYMAPERLDDIETHAGDIFGVGLILAELLGGRRFPEPPRSETRYQQFHHGVLEQVLARLADVGLEPAIVEPLVELVGRCLRYDHEQRPTAREVEREVRRLAELIPGDGLRDWAEDELPDPLAQSEAPGVGLAGLGLIGAGLLALVLIGTLVVILPPAEQTVPQSEPVAESAPEVVTPPKPPPPSAGARVRVAGDADRVVLKGEPGAFALSRGGKAVPAGTYQVHATFGADTMVATTVSVAAGEDVTVSCQSMSMVCSRR